MIKGIGIDLIEISRFSKVSKDFLKQIFLPQEITSSKNNISRLSQRFVLKEAILKALRKGMHYGFFWHYLRLTTNNIIISGPLRQNQSEKLSIHAGTGNTRKYACAVAVIGHKEQLILNSQTNKGGNDAHAII